MDDREREETARTPDTPWPSAMQDPVLGGNGTVPTAHDGQGSELERLRVENLALKSELIEVRIALSRRSANAQARPFHDLTLDLERALQALTLMPEGTGPKLRQIVRLLDLLNDFVCERDTLLQLHKTQLQEMSHRIKNDLQFVVSLLRIQSRGMAGAEAKDALALAGTRIEAMAKVHDLLCLTPGAERVAFDLYLSEICASLATCLGVDGGHRRLVVDAQSLLLPARTAQCLGLLVSELVTNAFRHAFAADGPGTVWVRSEFGHERRLTLTVADDGKGLPDGFAFGVGTGSGIVVALAKQTGATIAVSGEGGARFTLGIDV